MNAPLKILVIRLSSLGDILHALPAFFDLRTSFPDARIDWLAGHGAAPLLSAVRGIGTVHIFDKTAAFALPSSRAGRHSLLRVVRTLRGQQYGCCIDFQGLLKTALLSSLSGAGTRIGFPAGQVREWPAHWFYNRSPARLRQPLHVVELNRLLARCAGARPHSVPFDFAVSREDRDHVDSLISGAGLEDFVVINPGGGWESKTWKPEYYGELCTRIRDEWNLPVVVTTGPGEHPLYQRIAATCGGAPPAHFRVSFLQLIPLLEKARLLVGGDTGPFHLACALQTPVVGIFGPTSPVRNGPWRDADEAVTRGAACSGCYKRKCPTDGGCMDIPVDAVFSAVTRRLLSSGQKPL